MGKLAASIPTRPTTKCPVGRIYDDPDLDADDLAALDAVLSGPLSSPAVVAWLRRNGFATHKDTVTAHRKSKCRCVEA